MTASTFDPNWSLDREIVLCRVFDAPRELVFRVWSEPDHFTKWFSPAGFKTSWLEADIRVGGRCRFLYLGDDGSRWDNRMEFLEIVPNERIVFDHGSDVDDDPKRFRTTITFDSQSDGKTVLTLRQLHPTKAQRDAGIGFGAVAIGYTTLDALGRYVGAL